MILDIIIGIVILVCLMFIGIIIYYNSFQMLEIKVCEAENSIKSYLDDKRDILERIFNLINKINEKDEIYEINKIKDKCFDNFELSNVLTKCNKELNDILDESSALRSNKDLKNVMKELIDVNESIEASEKYYNDNVVIFNQKVKCFPSNLVGNLFKLKSKDFYEKKEEEMFEILKK